MKLQYKLRNFCCTLMIGVIGLVLACACFTRSNFALAEDEHTDGSEHFVTIYDDGNYLTVKTTASTVSEALERAEIMVDSADIVEPGMDAVIAGEVYNINIHRARPAVVIDGDKRRYLMTASYNPKTIAVEAGFAVYDGDEISTGLNDNFLEAGVASTYIIRRNGGRTVTLNETLPYPTETRYDYNLTRGESYVEQVGEDGRKVSVYDVEFVDNVEVSRTLKSEEIKLEPVPEIVVVGAKLSISPEQETCAAWLREAGVPENDLEAAIFIIYRESGCRVDAENPYSGAYGIPQALPGTKMATAGDDWRTNPITQIRWMDGYVRGRYGSWQGAVDFKARTGWY